MIYTQRIILLVACTIAGFGMGFAARYVFFTDVAVNEPVPTGKEFLIDPLVTTSSLVTDWRAVVLGQVQAIDSKTIMVGNQKGETATIALHAFTNFKKWPEDTSAEFVQMEDIIRQDIMIGDYVSVSVAIIDGSPEADLVTVVPPPPPISLAP